MDDSSSFGRQRGRRRVLLIWFRAGCELSSTLSIRALPLAHTDRCARARAQMCPIHSENTIGGREKNAERFARVEHAMWIFIIGVAHRVGF